MSGAPLDWNDVRFFLAVARARTLGRAAAALGVDQSTVGRRLASLEAKLGVALFARAATGFSPSAAGARVLEAAERMEEAARELSSSAAVAQAAAGTVRVATTDSLAEAFIVPALVGLRARHPQLRVILQTSWSRVDLRRGEADLAVRLVRPTDPRLARRKLGDFALRLYASRDWVAAHGMPRSLEGHPRLAYLEAEPDGDVALLTNSLHVLLAGAVAGLGIVQLPAYVGDPHPALVRVLPAVEERYAVWLVVPQATRRLAAVRAVTQAIVGAFKDGRPTRAPARAGRSPRTARPRR